MCPLKPQLSGLVTHLVQEDGSKCSIFAFDVNANRNRLPLARNALRKLKTIRHPGVVKMLDSVEVGLIRSRQDGARGSGLLEDKLDRSSDLRCD